MSTKNQFFKIIVVGAPNVGKTSFIQRYCNDQWVTDEPALRESTIGMDFHLKGIKIDGKPGALQIWDIAGQDRNFEVSKLFIRDAVGCIIICDAEKEDTLNSAVKWKQKIDSSCDRVDDKPIPCILLQNKSDLLSESDLKDEKRRERLALTSINAEFIAYYRVSAKTNTNIESAMNQLIESVTAFNSKKLKSTSKPNKSYPSVQESLRSGEQENRSSIKLTKPSKKDTEQKNGCC